MIKFILGGLLLFMGIKFYTLSTAWYEILLTSIAMYVGFMLLHESLHEE